MDPSGEGGRGAIFRPYSQSEALRSDRSSGDRQRHRQKVRKIIRDNIADLIAEESIVGQNRNKIIKVPIRSIKEYRFIYGPNTPGIGQGNGDSQPGQVVGKAGRQGQGAVGAGDNAGTDYYETDVTLEELIDIMFEDLELPDLERKAMRMITSERTNKRKGYRKVGVRVHLDKKRTAMSRLKRKLAMTRASRLGETPDPAGDLAVLDRSEALAPEGWAETELDGVSLDEIELSETPLDEEGAAALDPARPAALEARPGPGRRVRFHKDDLRFRRHQPDTDQESNAVVICIMDTSGSMDTMKKYLARSFFFLLYQFVRTKYGTVDLVFIAHDSRAREVTEEEFFSKGESGGTLISSGYRKALEIIQERFHPSLWNIYAFHCSDGDNFNYDNPAALKAARELCEACNLFGYGEIKPVGAYWSESSMIDTFSEIKEPNFQSVLIERKEDIWHSFKEFLARDRASA